MNKTLTSLNTFFLILLFFSLIFSIFSVPKLNVDEMQSIKVNFYKLIQKDDKLINASIPNSEINKLTKNTSANN